MEWFNSATSYAVLFGLFLIVLVIAMEHALSKLRHSSKKSKDTKVLNQR